MLSETRIPMSKAEAAELKRLRTENDSGPVSITRAEPNERGPLVVHIGERSWLIDKQTREITSG